MARARNIKPSFFDNDELAEQPPIGRLFFIGLWTIVDFKGSIEWRAKKIKAQILPYDECDIEHIAINLDKSGFIRFYSVQGKTYLNVVNFSKHQNPHKNEKQKGTEIPEFSESARQAVDLKGLAINRDLIVINPDEIASDPADSCFLIPDSCSLIPESNMSSDKLPKVNIPFEIFEYWCEVMKKNLGNSKLTPKREKAVKARLKEGYSVEQIKEAILNCSKDPFSMGQNDNHKKYNCLELICRTGEKLESFLDTPTPPNPPGGGLHNIKNIDYGKSGEF